MDKILVFYGNQPCLHIADNMGLHRDRNPDNGWEEMRNTTLNNVKEVELTPELKQILLEDIAFMWGRTSSRFTNKLKEFNLL